MPEFITDLSQHAFLRYALATGILVSVACGVIGSYVVTRRITYIAGAIAHSILGGMGAARYAQVVHDWQWAQPMLGAVVAALLSSTIIGVVTLRSRQREDTVIGAVWALGMAIGMMFIFKTPGYNENLNAYLFGSILMVTPNDLWLIAALDALVVGIGTAFYNPLMAVCFDEEFARVRGLHVELYFLLLLALTALTVVLLVSVVGIILVIALLTLPVAIAGHFTKRLWSLMALSILVTAILTTSGLAISYGPDLPTGATIIILAGFVYLVVVAVFRLRRQG